MAAPLLKDPEADGWERTDFPVVCEDCLGPNPYIRMEKTDYGKECAISGRPFTVFRFKSTVICREVALAKNVCQVCLLDLQYGLPVQVRDAALAAAGGGGGGQVAELPQTGANVEYATQQLAEKMAAGEYDGGRYGKAEPNEALRRLARTKPYYKRNRARICTFWLKNACTRTDCPFRPCNGDTDMPELKSEGAMRQQNIKDRYYGVNDPVAEKMMARQAERPALVPPQDASITTLWVGGLDERVDEESLRDHFYAHGEIKSVRTVPKRNCAFVTYVQRADAEKAAEKLGGGGLVIKGLRLKLMWGKPQAPPGGGASAPPPAAAPPYAAFAFPPPGVPPPGMPPPFAPPPGAAGRPLYPSMDPTQMGTAPAPQQPPPQQPPR